MGVMARCDKVSKQVRWYVPTFGSIIHFRHCKCNFTR